MHRLKVGVGGVCVAVLVGCFCNALGVAEGQADDHADHSMRGKILFLRCASCHDISDSPSAKIGPNLRGVLGRKVASLSGYSYSAALRSQDFVWDAPHLDRWIENPNGVAPGTIMAFAGITAEADRQAIIDYLKSRSAGVGP
jgi:cytochrome c